jgi:polyisoprenoid-binding protein YceI
MKPNAMLIAAAGATFLLFTSCSDPADKAYKAKAGDPTSGSTSAASAGADYVIRNESSIGFVASKVTRSHNGGFKNFAGTLKVADGKIVGTPEIKINMKSTWADDDRLTRHLMSQDFFNVDQIPTATFTATSITPTGGSYQVTGNLNLHGVAKSISFPATISIAAGAVKIKAEFAINRRDFNINYPGLPNDLIRDNVVIKLDVTASPGAARPQDQISI